DGAPPRARGAPVGRTAIAALTVDGGPALADVGGEAEFHGVL
ncbi:hypothetical protein AK812_SmicGene45953, partial [Symbiodinium microadriaticum]